MPPGSYPGDEYPFIAAVQELPTYGIIWVDPNQRDFHIGVTGDIPGAIEALKDGIPRGITVYFYLVEHTQEELCTLMRQIIDDRDQLATHGIFITGGGCGNKEMTVNLSMSPITPETMAFIRSRYDGPIGFDEGGDFPLRPFDPPVAGHSRLVAVRAGSEAALLSCGRRPFPPNGLDAPAGAESAGGPAADALRFALGVYDDMFPDLHSLTWQMVETDSYGATFLAKRGTGWLEVSTWAGTDQWAPGTVDDCDPQPFVPAAGGNAIWWLDPDYPAPRPDTTELHILVTETACTGSASPEGRIFAPVVEYAQEAVTMSVSIRVMAGMHTCPGNPYFPVTVALPEPLGDRELKGADDRPH